MSCFWSGNVKVTEDCGGGGIIYGAGISSMIQLASPSEFLYSRDYLGVDYSDFYFYTDPATTVALPRVTESGAAFGYLECSDGAAFIRTYIEIIHDGTLLPETLSLWLISGSPTMNGGNWVEGFIDSYKQISDNYILAEILLRHNASCSWPEPDPYFSGTFSLAVGVGRDTLATIDCFIIALNASQGTFMEYTLYGIA